ncbi:helix-turn-helix domain-containing protein [Listeria booriae]|uniref:helix-turn-helix domain-containing protein n=1 Tax=Listeria booriae TaxID=1552123 RepID=UPI001624A756|nr:helix-turn-helix domain-containing protein [Listeria booriae]MBC1356663.1 helix-turn-helix domain-containing protein [Listeria booriae]
MVKKDGYTIQLENIHYLAPTTNSGTTIFFVLEGELRVTSAGQTFLLQESDLIVINHQQHYSIRGVTPNIVMKLQITGPFFALYYPAYFQYSFDCFSSGLDTGREKMVTLLRKNLANMMIATANGLENSVLESQSALFQMMLLLTRFFKNEHVSEDKLAVHDTRITRIIQQLEQQFDEPITLQSIAEQEYLSVAYLSRYFKKMTGLGFLQYLTQIRLEHSLEDLCYSSATISQIAQKNGFSSSKNFTTSFKTYYGKSPASYRRDFLAAPQALDKQQTPIPEVTSIKPSPAVLVKLSHYRQDAEKVSFMNEIPFEQKQIAISLGKQETIPQPLHILTIGELKEVLHHNVQTQIEAAAAELRVRYVGIRHLIFGSTLLSEKETDETMPTSSPYANASLAIDYLKKLDISLFIRVEYQDISSDETLYFEKLTQFMQHMIQVYGSPYVKTWYFMYYEPYNTVASRKELQRVYLKLREVIKSFHASIQVGSYLPFSERRETPLANHEWVLKNRDAVDFIGFNANQNEAVDFTKSAQKDFIITKDYVLSKTQKLKRYLKENRWDKPLMLTNWNTLTGNTRYTNGTFFRGALIFQTVLAVSSEVAGLGFWINTELHEEDLSGRNIRLDGLELFHFFNGKRPAYFSLKFKERLRGKIVARGEHFVMTENEDGYQLVLLNCTNMNPLYSVEDSFLRDYRKEFHVELDGLVPGEYQLRKFQFDRENGALYSKYWQLNSKHGLDSEIMDYIVQDAQPTLSVSDELITENWSFYAYLDVNAIQFYEFRRTL